MKKAKKKADNINDDPAKELADRYGYKLETARVLLLTKGSPDPLTILELLKSDPAFEADKYGQLLMTDSDFAAKELSKSNIDWENKRKVAWEKIQKKIRAVKSNS